MRVLIHVHDEKGRVKIIRTSRPPLDPAAVDELVTRLMIALTIARAKDRTNDEDPGHKFHGNQWTGGLGSKPDVVKAKGVKAGTHELLSSGHPFTMEELQKVTGASTLKQIGDALAMLKNPKYAGPQGTLEIVKGGGHYFVKPSVVSAVPIEQPLAGLPIPDDFTAPAVGEEGWYPGKEEFAEDPEPELEPGMLGFVPVEAHPVPGISTKEAADKAYNEQIGYVLSDVALSAKSTTVGQEHDIALAFKNGKAQAMAQWSANVKGHPVKPKAQDVFAADKQLITDLAQGMDKHEALAAWKKNTSLEKQGKFPPGAAINKMPPKVHLPDPPMPDKEHAQALVAPIEYVPENHVHVEASDFAASPGAVNGKFAAGINKLKSQLAAGHPDAVDNKIGVQAVLEKRLMESPAFMQMQAEYKKTHDNSLAARLINSWAGSSGDHQPISVANQLATRDAFGMDPAKVSTDAFHLLNTTKGDEHEVYKQAAQALGCKFDSPAAQATFKAGLRDFALAQYQSTQDHFKQLGITELYLARGMKIQHSGGPDLVNLKLQPASSFSANFGTASGFSGGASMYFSKVPASQVLSSYVTGFGCTSEHEVVVLAHPEMRAVRVPTGQAGGSMSNAAAVISNALKAPAATGMKPVFKSPSTKGAKHPLVKIAKAAAAKGDEFAVQAAYNEIAAQKNPITGKSPYQHSLNTVMNLHGAAVQHKAALEAWHAANPKTVKKVKAATPAAQVNLTPTHTAGAHAPAHHAAHSHYDPDEYKAWQAKGYTEFQLGKKLAMKKFLAKKKGS